MKKILIISGGISKERAISLNTGKQVAKELNKNNYKAKITEPNFKLLDVIKSFKPKIIFNALHGQFGEDGYIQSILETTKIPYTHSGVVPSAIAMDKELSKKMSISPSSTFSGSVLSVLVLLSFTSLYGCRTYDLIW